MKLLCRINLLKSLKCIFLFSAFVIGLDMNAQQGNLDSLIATKNTVYIEGIIPASVTHEYESKAILLDKDYKGLITTWLSKNNW